MDLILVAFRRATGERRFFAFPSTGHLSLGSAAWNDIRVSGSDVLEEHLALSLPPPPNLGPLRASRSASLDGQAVRTEEAVWVRAVSPSAVDANRIAACGRPQSFGSINGSALWPTPGPQDGVEMRLGDVLVIGEWELSLECDSTVVGELDRVEREFLAAIERAPSDDDNRHTYGDWLEEHGRHDEAEFVRAQIELASRAAADGRSQSLAARLDEIGSRMRPRWRRAVARAPVENCEVSFEVVCPKRGTHWRRRRIRTSVTAVRATSPCIMQAMPRWLHASRVASCASPSTSRRRAGPMPHGGRDTTGGGWPERAKVG
jgi:uncharacterized protein (TIGR02996 family)